MIPDDIDDKEYAKLLETIPSLKSFVLKYNQNISDKDIYFMMEFVLWALSEFSKLSRDRYEQGFQFNDLFGSYLSDTLKGDL